MKTVIKIDNLSKCYGNISAVNHLSLQVQEGQLFSFLGINGAGKSTTIHMICGELKKDTGTILVCGKEVDSHETYIKQKIGLVFQESLLDKSLSVYDNLKYKAVLYGITGEAFKRKYQELSALFDLKEIEKQTIGKLSGGQRRKVDIARAIIHEPEILILDEPTTGLDPGARKRIWKILNSLRQKKQLTIFLTTHYMEEAADSDYIVILDKGTIVAEGTPLDLKNQYAHDTVLIFNVEEKEIQKLNKPYIKIQDGFKLTVNTLEEVTQWIMQYPNIFKDYEVIKGKMDDVFLNATGYVLEVKS